MYTIGQVSKMFHLPISTLRYYDKDGLFPNITRTSGMRRFSDSEIEALRVIECLKKSNMEIKDIKQFMLWCEEGRSTYSKRLELFQKQKQVVETEIQNLEAVLCMLKYKCWYYEQAKKAGNEDHIHAMLPDQLPEAIQKLFDEAHKIV